MTSQDAAELMLFLLFSILLEEVSSVLLCILLRGAGGVGVGEGDV